jgi:hypothetical protein
MATPLTMSKLNRRVSMCVVELAERGARAALGIFILGHLAEKNKARPLQGLGDLDGVDDVVEWCMTAMSEASYSGSGAFCSCGRSCSSGGRGAW